MTTLPSSNPPSAKEQRAYDTSIGYNILVGACATVIVIGLLLAGAGNNMLIGWMTFAAIVGPLFLIISFIRNVTLISMTTSQPRKIYAIIATIVTGLLCFSCLLALLLPSLLRL